MTDNKTFHYLLPQRLSLVVVVLVVALGGFSHDRQNPTTAMAAAFVVVPSTQRRRNRIPATTNNWRTSSNIIQSSSSTKNNQVTDDSTTTTTTTTTTTRNAVDTVDGPFQPTTHLAAHWGRHPILIRNAFSANELRDHGVWPNWEDICNWVSSSSSSSSASEEDDDEEEAGYGFDDYDEDEENELPVMSRLIRKKSEQLDSFSLEFGPFSKSYLETLLSNDNNKAEGTWTLLLNDVDRIHPPLSDWMHQTFGLGSNFKLPGWRLDDGQISIAKTGGGIGPHVDNYDVFLIQTSGRREWRLGEFLDTEQEMEALIDGLEVRILDLGQEGTTTTEISLSNKNNNQIVAAMEEGDMLYLPPRLTHWGTSQSDDCMTLSVGCRAPSATELVSKVAEHLAQSMAPKAVRRYTDKDLLSMRSNTDDGTNDDAAAAPTTAGSITSQVKDDLKQMVLEAVEDILDNPLLWDEIVGDAVTVPKRPVETDDEAYSEGDTSSARAHVLAALQDGVGALIPTEGVSFATSQVVQGQCTTSRIFADGQMFEWETTTQDVDSNEEEQSAELWSSSILFAIDKRLPLDDLTLGTSTSQQTSTLFFPPALVSALEGLLKQGFLYYADEEEEEEEQ